MFTSLGTRDELTIYTPEWHLWIEADGSCFVLIILYRRRHIISGSTTSAQLELEGTPGKRSVLTVPVSTDLLPPSSIVHSAYGRPGLPQGCYGILLEYH